MSGPPPTEKDHSMTFRPRASSLTLAGLGAAILATAALAAPPDFGTLDRDGDGFITREEVEAARPANRAGDRFVQADIDGDGGLSAEEMVEMHREKALARAQATIDKHDQNGDGLLQAEEMRRGGPESGDGHERQEGGGGGSRVDRMFEHLRADGDGRISQAEFDARPRRPEGGRMSGEGAPPIHE